MTEVKAKVQEHERHSPPSKKHCEWLKKDERKTQRTI
jgi:hypothetical protein